MREKAGAGSLYERAMRYGRVRHSFDLNRYAAYYEDAFEEDYKGLEITEDYEAFYMSAAMFMGSIPPLKRQEMLERFETLRSRGLISNWLWVEFLRSYTNNVPGEDDFDD